MSASTNQTANEATPILTADGVPFSPGMRLWWVLDPTLADGTAGNPVLRCTRTSERDKPERYGTLFIVGDATIGLCFSTAVGAIAWEVARLETAIANRRRRIALVMALDPMEATFS